LEHLKTLATLESLSVGQAKITDAGLVCLKGLSQLKRISLEGCRGINGTGLQHLKGQTSLKELDLKYTSANDAGLKGLSGLTSLETLRLTGCREITDSGLEHLKALATLKTLELSFTGISDAGLANLTGLTSLETLNLQGTKVSGSGLAHLKAATRLKKLTLYGSNISNADMVHLKQLTQLEELNLGKTEISRRLASLTGAPFIKVEASKYTEVGYYGRDVESMIRDLLDAAINLVTARKRTEVEEPAKERVEERLLDLLVPPSEWESDNDDDRGDESLKRHERTREKFRKKLRAGELEERMVELTVEQRQSPVQVFSNMGMEQMDIDLQGMLERMMPRQSRVREVTIKEARRILLDQETEALMDRDAIDVLDPGWQRKWRSNFATLQMAGDADEDLVMDGWTDIAQRIRRRVIEEMSKPDAEISPDIVAQVYLECDDEKMQEIRARVDEIVEDPTTAEALKPWYRQLCKRPCFHDEYLQAYNVPTCHLIDTDGRGVDRIDETGVWANGEHFELDCVVLASGFEVHLAHSATYETVGRGGLTLSEHWSDGMRSLHGAHVHGFPNLFVEGLSQGARLISNITHNLDEVGLNIAAVIAHTLDTGVDEVEATAEAERSWMELLDTAPDSLLSNPDCTPGYYNNEGQDPTPADVRNARGYPAGPEPFFAFIEAWRRSGEFEGLEFRGGRRDAGGQ
ncbi:MAG: hypothetical protein IH940_03610, partial [Acidobacteria bacterium]|nr:hypothetical protein [Acidobacteriota bacterium]